mgnify:CR=1 FL=1
MNYEDHAHCFQRLLKEYKEHGKLVIAFDFDNTVYDFHKAGLNLKRARAAIIQAKSLGHEVYCFTANNDENFVKDFCKLTLGFIPAINESSIDHLFGTRKPFYSLLLDDRAGLSSALNLLIQLNEHIINEKPTSDTDSDYICDGVAYFTSN